ncbi:hypothetical protein UMZ34_16145 [Halopseudomonas pachastrellae]|nr:hypothetical protein UMZ34_16145 [Halopseudomonas pachastrellae]
MSDLLPTLHGLLQSDPLPMMLVDAGGQPMFRNGALLALASDTQGLAAWLPPQPCRTGGCGCPAAPGY